MPKLGVISVNKMSSELLDAIITQGRDLDYEELEKELESAVEDGKMTDDEKYAELEKYESDSDFRHVIFGDWKLNDQGKYEPDVENSAHGFALELGSTTATIFWSTTIVNCAETSPCYLMFPSGERCGDLDTPGNYETYGLPDWALYEE